MRRRRRGGEEGSAACPSCPSCPSPGSREATARAGRAKGTGGGHRFPAPRPHPAVTGTPVWLGDNPRSGGRSQRGGWKFGGGGGMWDAEGLGSPWPCSIQPHPDLALAPGSGASWGHPVPPRGGAKGTTTPTRCPLLSPERSALTHWGSVPCFGGATHGATTLVPFWGHHPCPLLFVCVPPPLAGSCVAPWQKIGECRIRPGRSKG